MDMVAEQTGGRAFYNGNDLGGIIDKVTSSSSDFYTLSYTPTDTNMNGALRKIGVNVSGGKYTLSYRHGYYAREDSAPGSAQGAQQQAAQHAAQNGDPLGPFMDFGLPQTDQILYTERIVPAAPTTQAETSGKSDKFAVDFVVPLTDLDLKLNAGRDPQRHAQPVPHRLRQVRPDRQPPRASCRPEHQAGCVGHV